MAWRLSRGRPAGRLRGMDGFPTDVRFRLTWRAYQQRVLDDLDEHLGDGRLHVVAAPGSGKTVLGLEVVRRLGPPALVLSPTLTIRNQWIERLVGLFMPPGSRRPDWVSTDVHRPALLTAVTYQALHVAHAGGEPVLKGLAAAGVRTLVVDEAHHLRAEWWKSLMAARAALDGPIVVALTATPPYDVPPAEWERYKDLCGPIDAEISVPELVRAGDLCPHQDYVHVSVPTEEEARRIRGFRRDVEEFRRWLCADEGFVAALQAHPYVASPRAHMEEFLGEPEYASSMVVFLTGATGSPPAALLRVMGLPRRKVPALDLEWLEVLLTGVLYADRGRFAEHEEVMAEVQRRLSRVGAIERRKVRLRNTRQIARTLALSLSKVRSIDTILELEHSVLGDDLRMVVLTDYIRKADLPHGPDDVKPIRRMGVVPIFEHLRRQGHAGVRLGVLSGSLVIVPAGARGMLQSAAAEVGIGAGSLRAEPLKHDAAYLAVDVRGQEHQRIVRLITRVFSQGAITCLVGTKSLLGEGWDAPGINALVLASFVGSYMLSNQMRGRAIRVQPGNPTKTADIWHLICIEPGMPEPGEDLELLDRRFRAFVGVSATEDVIVSGIDRLNIGRPPYKEADVDAIDDAMLARAAGRDELRERWRRALGRPEEGRSLVEGVQAPQEAVRRGFVFRRTLVALLWEALFAGGGGAMLVLHAGEGRPMQLRSFLLLLAVALGVGALVSLPRLLKAGWIFLRYGPVSGDLRQVGYAVLEALREAQLVRTRGGRLKVNVSPGEQGAVFCSLSGGTPYETSLYLNSLQQVLGPIENPRYLLVRTSFLGWLRRRDYHAVPTELGRTRGTADGLVSAWRRYVGPAEAVYTRNTEGRELLLRARAHSLAGALSGRSERVSCWK